MLNAYLTATSNLLQNPAAPSPLYDTGTITGYINSARGQIAGESGCIRGIGTIAGAASTQAFPFSAITIPGSSAAGIEGVLNVRTVWLQGTSGLVWMAPESFEEFSLYDMNVPNGTPARWAQYAQGTYGSIYVSPISTAPVTLAADCSCYPVPLVNDTTAEAIPYLWTDAVPYFAAYLALLSSQTGARTADADKMMQRYTEFVERAKRAATGDVLPWQYQGQPVPGGLNTPAAPSAR